MLCAGSCESTKMLKIFIKCNAFDYTRGILTVILRSNMKEYKTSNEALLVNDGIRKRLKPFDLSGAREWAAPSCSVVLDGVLRVSSRMKD